jgi:hypothetical protein
LHVEKRALIGLAIAVVTTVTGVLAAPISLNGDSAIELGRGQERFNACSTEPQLDIDTAFDANEVLFISRLVLSQIPSTCDGQRLELRLLDSNGQTIESIVWELDHIASSDSSIAALADGTSTSTASASSDGVSQIFPSSALNTPAAGLALETTRPSDVASFQIIVTE